MARWPFAPSRWWPTVVGAGSGPSMNSFQRLVGVLLASWMAVPAASMAASWRWEAGRPPREQGIRLEVGSDSTWRIEDDAVGSVARLAPSTNTYNRTAYRLRFDSGVASDKGWLVLEFVDRGLGLISVSPGVPETRQWGVARVGSGRVRRAVVHHEGGRPASVRIEGLDWLRSVEWTDVAPPREDAPLVEPAVRFAVPSERVTSAGADSAGPDEMEAMLAGLRNQLPLLRALGFNGVESYVRWGWVERRPGVWDWSYYDAILAEIERHGLKWFPMLLAGSGYALPAWHYESTNNVGFRCLEHGIAHDTQSIFDPRQAEYAARFIAEFGRHYRDRPSLLGIRLGPSGDYGEAQYPAKGPGYGFKERHTHIGWWAGDDLARAAFRNRMKEQYGEVTRLNAAWESQYRSFEEVHPFLPETALTRRQRLDFSNWYMGAMSEWCERWAVWARAALPESSIHQSSGGWGPPQIGTDYTHQARSMARIGGGLRLTNEGDDYADNFTITRLASSAARFYRIPTGYEPGGFGSRRGVMARLFNAVTTGGVHLFYYLGNLTANDQAIDLWLRHASLLDRRARPLVEVAAFYPDTAAKLDDEVVRYRWGSNLYSVARRLREEVDFDFASEPMILDGALERYRVLVFLWGAITERPVLERIDSWVRGGGTLVFASRPRGLPATVEGEAGIARRWMEGDTGQGRVIPWPGDLIPSHAYSDFVKQVLLGTPAIRPEVREALRMRKPSSVYWSVLENRSLALLNFDDRPARVELRDGRVLEIEPYGMRIEPWGVPESVR